MSGFDECSTTMSVIDEAYGPHCDLYRDVLGVHSNATPEQMQHAYFHRRNELFQLLSSMEQDEQDSITDSHRFHAERKLDAVVTAMRILGDPELRIQYDDMRHERMKKGSNLQQHHHHHHNNNNNNPALREFEDDEPEMTRSCTPKSALKSSSNSSNHNRSVATSARSSASSRRSQPPPVPVSPTTTPHRTTSTTTTMEVDANGFPRCSPSPQPELQPHSKVKKKKKTKKRSHPPEPSSSNTRSSSAAAADHYGSRSSSGRRVKHFSTRAAAAVATTNNNTRRTPDTMERSSSHGKRREDHPSGRRVRKNDRNNMDERGQDEDEEDEEEDDENEDEEFFEQDAFEEDDDDEEEEEDVISEETEEYHVKKKNTARELRKMEESARAAKTSTTTTKHSSKLSRAVAVAKKKSNSKISTGESPAAKATAHPSATTKSVDFMIPEQSPSTEADVATDGNETILDSATMDETTTLATDNLSVGEATSSYYLESPTEATDEGTILSDDWSEGADTLTVGQGTESVITRVRDEFWGAIEDTTVSVQQVLNVFTLQDEDIRAVTGQIKKARNQISRAF